MMPGTPGAAATPPLLGDKPAPAPEPQPPAGGGH
jgi:hypothetical protein